MDRSSHASATSARGRPVVWPPWLSRVKRGMRPESLEGTMNSPLHLGRRATAVVVTVTAIVCAAVLMKSGSGQPAPTRPPQRPGSVSNTPQSEATVDLSSNQLNAISIEPVGTYLFPFEKEAVGSIAFVDDLSVQVFPPNQGKLRSEERRVGKERRSQTLQRCYRLCP